MTTPTKSNPLKLTLRQARCEFSAALAHLVLHAISLGYEVALDEVTERITDRDPNSDHMKNSLHHLGLAADLLLYKDGKYLMKSEEYQELGEWWEVYGEGKGLPLVWGGRFHDGNHFSLSWGGRK